MRRRLSRSDPHGGGRTEGLHQGTARSATTTLRSRGGRAGSRQAADCRLQVAGSLLGADCGLQASGLLSAPGSRRSRAALRASRTNPDGPCLLAGGRHPGGSARCRCRTPDSPGRAVARGDTTPAPWINVIANEHTGFVVTESGSGFSWSLNSQENQLTPWSNDPVTDPPGQGTVAGAGHGQAGLHRGQDQS